MVSVPIKWASVARRASLAAETKSAEHRSLLSIEGQKQLSLQEVVNNDETFSNIAQSHHEIQTCGRHSFDCRQKLRRQQHIRLPRRHCQPGLLTLALQRDQLAAHALMQRSRFTVRFAGAWWWQQRLISIASK